MGKTTSIVLMVIAGLLTFAGWVDGNISDILLGLVLVMYARIAQEWK